jgi:nucleotide-binding universal stress UspA family protein
VSQDIPDNLGRLSGSFVGLVVAGGVDGELGEELTVFGDDSDVAVGDEEQDVGAGVAAADAEVAEPGLVAQRDVAAAVDAVPADPVVAQPMRTIVVGVDGSPPSLRALHFAADLAGDLHDAEVVVVFARHVNLFMPPHVAEDMYADVLDRAEAMTEEEAGRALEGKDLRWKFLSRDGEPSHVLSAVADELGASFIVVGRHGWSTAHELFVGSVSHRLVHQAACPVVVVSS